VGFSHFLFLHERPLQHSKEREHALPSVMQLLLQLARKNAASELHFKFEQH
jgi:hypothetical protein